MFGYATFGTVYGAIICLSGIFTFTQSGLQALLHDWFEDDPEPINLGLATAGLVLGVALVMYVDIKGRAMQRDRAIAALNDERRPLLAGQQSQQAQQRSLRANGRPIPTSVNPGVGNGETSLAGSLRASSSGAIGGLGAVSAGGASGAAAGVADDPERHRLLDRPSRQALFDRALSTVQETREPETREV